MMARTISNFAGLNHPSGYTTNINADKWNRELYVVLVAIGWSNAAAEAFITIGGIDKVDEFIELKDGDIAELCKAIDTLMWLLASLRSYAFRPCVGWLATTNVSAARLFGRQSLRFKDQMEFERDHENSDIDFLKATASALRDSAKLKEEMIAALTLSALLMV